MNQKLAKGFTMMRLTRRYWPALCALSLIALAAVMIGATDSHAKSTAPVGQPQVGDRCLARAGGLGDGDRGATKCWRVAPDGQPIALSVKASASGNQSLLMVSFYIRNDDGLYEAHTLSRGAHEAIVLRPGDTLELVSREHIDQWLDVESIQPSDNRPGGAPKVGQVCTTKFNVGAPVPCWRVNGKPVAFSVEAGASAHAPYVSFEIRNDDGLVARHTLLSPRHAALTLRQGDTLYLIPQIAAASWLTVKAIQP